MTLAMRPAEYRHDDATTGGWLVGDRVLATNPRRLVTPADHQMVRIWLACRPGGLGGARLLPDAGGVVDQVTLMMDALAIMDDEAARWNQVRRPEERTG